MQLHHRAGRGGAASKRWAPAAATADKAVWTAVDLEGCCKRQIVCQWVQHGHDTELVAQRQHLIAHEVTDDCA